MTRKKSPAKAEKTVAAKDIFLATLGLYGKIYEKSADLANQLNEKGLNFFNDLVSHGEKFERQAKKKYSQLKTDGRIEKLRSKFTKTKSSVRKRNVKSSQVAA